MSMRRRSDGTEIGEPLASGHAWLAVSVADGGVRLQLRGEGRSFACSSRTFVRLLDLLRRAGRAAFPADELPSEAASALDAPGERDDLYVPGQPWRRGKWIAPVARMSAWDRARNAEHGR